MHDPNNLWTPPPHTGRAMRPTENLRFVERQQPLGDGTARKVRVLQQAWAPVYGGPCEWRDVPLEVEQVQGTPFVNATPTV